MPETPRGLRFPTLGDSPNVPRDVEALAEDVEALIVSGTGVIAGTTVASGGATQVEVVFPTPYTIPPAVFVDTSGNPGGTGQLVLKAGQITTTQFTCLAYNVGPNIETFPDWAFVWLAVKKTV